MITKLIDWLRRRLPLLPDPLWQHTLAALPFLSALNEDEERRLRSLVEQFLTEKEFASAGGLELTNVICASIAAQGCLPILNLGIEWYRGWVGIIVYPDEFVIPRTVEDEFGIVHEYEEVAAGEAWDGGPLLISWHDAQMAGEGYNVVIHEFAHKLDMRGGEANGVPPLPPQISLDDWQRVLLGSYEDFCALVDQTEEDEGLVFDPYAAESPGEFFAVMSEVFFETPDLLVARYPALYANLAVFYRQDPLSRSRA